MNPSRSSVVSGDSESGGKRRDELRSELDRVHELALRRPGMCAAAAERDPHLEGGERLDLELAEAGAVERVRRLGAELLEVEVVGSAPDLLVDRERNAHRRARLGRLDEIRDAAMISATPALSSAPSSVVPSLVTMSCPMRTASACSSAGSITWLGSPGSVIAPACVVLVHDRGDAGPRRLGRRVDVGDQADHRRAVGARQGGKDVAVLGQLDVVETDLGELGDEEPGEIELLGGARDRLPSPPAPGCRSGRSGGTARARRPTSSAASGDENGALPKIGEVAIERGSSLDPERKVRSRDALVRRVDVRLVEGEPGEHGRDAARCERRDERDRSAGANEQGPNPEGLLERVEPENDGRSIRWDQAGWRGREQRDLELRPGRCSVAQERLEGGQRSRPDPGRRRAGSRRSPRPRRRSPSSGGSASLPGSRARRPRARPRSGRRTLPPQRHRRATSRLRRSRRGRREGSPTRPAPRRKAARCRPAARRAADRHAGARPRASASAHASRSATRRRTCPSEDRDSRCGP